MSGRYYKKFLIECYINAGIAPEIAAEKATSDLNAICHAIAVGAASEKVLDAWNREALVYAMRKNQVPFSAIQRHWPVSRAALYSAIRRHLKNRRMGLKLRITG